MHSPFHAGSLSLVIKPATGHVSPQFNVVFDHEFSKVPFTRERKIPPNWTDLVQHISKSGSQENIDLRDTWFTPDLEENPIETPTHVPRVTPESLVSEGAPVSEVIKHPVSERVQNISNLSKVCFAKQSYNLTSGMPSSEGEK